MKSVQITSMPNFGGFHPSHVRSALTAAHARVLIHLHGQQKLWRGLAAKIEALTSLELRPCSMAYRQGPRQLQQKLAKASRPIF